MAENGPTQENVDIANELLKALQAVSKEMDNVANKAKGVGAALSEGLGGAVRENAESVNQSIDNQRKMAEGMEEVVQGADGLRAALGRNKAAADELSPSFQEIANGAIDVGTQFSLMSTALSVGYESFSAIQGVFGLFSSGLSGIFGLFQSGIGFVTGFFGSLFDAAASYRNGAGKEMFEANQDIIKQFGDLNANEGAFIKQMASDMQAANSSLQGANNSLYGAIGNSAAVLKEATAIAAGFGNQLTALAPQLKGAADEMVLMSKGMNMSAESFKQLALNAKMTGGSMEEEMQTMMVASAHLANQYGVDVKQIGKNLDQLAKDFENFGHLSSTEMAATATYAAKLGIEIQALQGVMDKFDSFESAAQAAGQLNEAFGMNIDTMKMMNEENPAKRMDMLRESLAATGKSFEDLSRQEKKLMAQTTGMSMQDLQAAMSLDPDEMGFDDVMADAEEAAEKMSPEDAMIQVAKSIEKMSHSFKQMTSGPLSEFLRGFMEVLERSPEFRELLSYLSKFLLEFYNMGKEVGKLFLEKFDKPIQKVLGMFKQLFDTSRIKEFTSSITGAFGTFFEEIQGADPAAAGTNLMTKLFDAIKTWLGGAPAATDFGMMIKDMITRGIKVLGGMIPAIIKKAAEFVRSFTEKLKGFIEGDNKTVGQLTDGIGGAFIEAMSNIFDVVKTDLGPALYDLFMYLFETYKDQIAKGIGLIIGYVIVKGMISAMFTVGASALLKKAVGSLSGNLGGILGSFGLGNGQSADASEGGAVDAAKEAMEASGEALKTGVEKIAEMDKGQINKAGDNLFAITFGKFLFGMVAMLGALGLVAYAMMSLGVPLDYLVALIAGIGVITLNISVVTKIAQTVNKKTLGKAALIMIAAGAFVGLMGASMGRGIKNMTNELKGINFMDAVLSLTLVGIALAGVITLAILAASFAPALGPMAIGMLVVTFAGLFIAALGPLLGYGLSEFIKQFQGIDMGKSVAMMFQLAAVMGALVFIVAATIPLAAYGAIAYLLMSAGGLMPVSDFIREGLPYLGEALVAGFAWADKVKFGQIFKAMGAIVLLLPIIGVLMVAGAAFTAMSFWGVLDTIRYGIARMADFFGGVPGDSADLGVMGYIGRMIEAVNALPMPNIDEVKSKLEIVMDIIDAVSGLAELAIKAGEIAIVAGLLDGDREGGGPTAMMKAMGSFIPGIAESIQKVVEGLLAAAEGITDPKALQPKMEIILSIIRNITEMGLALMEPMQKIVENKTAWQSFFGSSAAQDITAMAQGIVSILAGLKDHLPPIVQSLIDMTANIKDDPDSFQKKALGLEALMNALLAAAQGVEILYQMSLEKGWFSDTSNVEKLKEIMRSMRSVIGAEMQTLMVTFSRTVSKLEYVTNKQVALAIKDTFFNLKQVGLTIEKFYKSMSKRWWTWSPTMSFLLNAFYGGYMPSNIVTYVVMDVKAISDVLRENDTDVPFDILHKFIDMFYTLPFLFDAIMMTNAAGKEVMKTKFVNFTDKFEQDLISGLHSMEKVIGALSAHSKFMQKGNKWRDLRVLSKGMERSIERKYTPANLVREIAKEAGELADAMEEIDIDLGKIELKPITKSLLGSETKNEFVVRPEQMNIKLNLKIAMGAKQLAKQIQEGNSDTDGFFSVTPEARNYLDQNKGQ